ncbi:uncharacterized protein LOC123315083 [Coccinella septempunctata]|uniref:uncharacterized protein LOC123315083 n=1 Tax=Coccinella septempunctata TaxID=41139 RepID=UPI001D0743C8|nr:uncharacterized protein LOC123315083 [Coccinella septempunctata]
MKDEKERECTANEVKVIFMPEITTEETVSIIEADVNGGCAETFLLVYVAGLVFRGTHKKISCTDCSALFSSDELEAHNMFILNKEWSDEKRSLYYPSIYRKDCQRIRTGTDKDMNIVIATYNVRSLSNDARLLELEEVFKTMKWDKVGLSEVKRRGEACYKLESGNILYYKGRENDTLDGVGFLISKRYADRVKNFTGVSERVAIVVISLNKTVSLKNIQIYAPTSTHDDEEVEAFYETITTAIGSSGYGNRNERGEILMNFLETNNLYAINTFFKKKPQRKWTWISPNRKTKNEIDYVLAKEKFIVQDVTPINNVISKRIDTELLKINSTQYASHLKEPCDLKLEELSLDEMNEVITDQLLKASSRIAAHKQTNKLKISNKSQEMLRKRRKLLNDNKRNTVEFTELNKTIRKQIKAELKKLQEERIQTIIENNRNLKNMKSRVGIKKIILLKNQGTEIRNKNELVKITEEYYEKLYSSRNPPSIATTENLKRVITNVNSEEMPDITVDEIDRAI